MKTHLDTLFNSALVFGLAAMFGVALFTDQGAQQPQPKQAELVAQSATSLERA
ncbi:hypothetical protein [Chitinimonas naiadis]